MSSVNAANGNFTNALANTVVIASKLAGDPASQGVGRTVLYSKDDGSGNTQLRAKIANTSPIILFPDPYFTTVMPRLTATSTTALALSRGVLPIKSGGQWRPRNITTPLTITNSGLTASTAYYVYCYDNAGTLTLELSTTGHAIDTAFGVETKSGDATRTLVGMVVTNGSTPGQFQDTAQIRGTISFYARKDIALAGSFSTNRTTTSTSATEINTEIRTQFLSWADEAVVAGASGWWSVGTGNATCAGGIGIDSGSVLQNGYTSFNNGTVLTALNVPFSVACVLDGVAEGALHYLTILGSTSTGTLTFFTPLALYTKIRG